MFSLGYLTYLDPEKTGSSFITRFLSETGRQQPEHDPDQPRQWKHMPVGSTYDASRLYVISVREPVAQYGSLFRFGRAGRGGLHRRLKQHGLEHLYRDNTFSEWLGFITSVEGLALTKRQLDFPLPEFPIGVMTLRHLALALSDPEQAIKGCGSLDELIDRYRSQRIYRHVLRQENLNDDLRNLATHIAPDLFDADRVAAFLSTTDRINATVSSNSPFALAPSDRRHIEAVDRLLFECHGYPLSGGSGQPTASNEGR